MISELNFQVFGYQVFKEFQLEIINAVMSGEDILVLMPTGSGKTLTYQLPGLISEGLTIVIQPLISLITDQVNKLQNYKIPVVVLNSTQDISQQDEAIKRIEYDPEVKFLYITPEKLAQSARMHEILQNLYKNERISRLVIDEAHCIDQWGNDFRPDYLKLRDFRLKFPDIPIIALTASASLSVKTEISKILLLKDPLLFTTGFNRPNFVYEVREKKANINQDIGNFIINRHPNESGIIYCNFIKDCEYLSKVLKHNYKLSCGFYHGELSSDKRNHIYRQ